jgi:hypothetical protein
MPNITPAGGFALLSRRRLSGALDASESEHRGEV